MAKHLSGYFEGVAAKRLSPTEVDPDVSNGHEFGGVARLRALLGDVSAVTPKVYLPARFLYLGDDEEESLSAEGTLTWYDARANQPHRTAEYRLYVSDNAVYEAASAKDLLVVAKRPGGELLIVIVKAGSTYEAQIRWLFDLPSDLFTFSVQQVSAGPDREIGFAERFILDELGVEVEQADENWLDRILARFDTGFPATAPFSAFARETLPDLSPHDGADAALMAWMNQEEMLFRTLERHIVGERIATGFTDVDDFISYSLSVQNRRKSRVGRALENHLEQVFGTLGVACSRGQETENKAKPDFIFPGIAQYHDPAFPEVRLTMLGVKSTCKDRWRQVLSEAARIPDKHLLTLEPGISTNQTNEMQANRLQLVLPSSLHPTYTNDQQAWLMSLNDFVSVVANHQ